MYYIYLHMSIYGLCIAMIVAALESHRMHTVSYGAMELCCCGSCSVCCVCEMLFDQRVL